ncbi:MAG TPA: hypothetical protein DF774_02170 [Rheinheimera sp.]|uniref:hypothetical protein n=1 Tax=Rheinheimera sp. TaxID=1869214 RepID=UPI000ED64E11|nr:hypothetical protein [Rheinheimera sp.]HCU64546.1 hypothetical protein [Rheinheimera sp.]
MKLISNPPVETPIPDEPLPILGYANPVVSVDGQTRIFVPVFSVGTDSLIRIEADLTGIDPLGEPFVYPVTLPGNTDTPIVRHARGVPTTDEKYLYTTITNGHVVMQGRLPSGDWKILQDRVNEALKVIEAPFEVSMPTITFHVSTPI